MIKQQTFRIIRFSVLFCLQILKQNKIKQKLLDFFRLFQILNFCVRRFLKGNGKEKLFGKEKKGYFGKHKQKVMHHLWM